MTKTKLLIFYLFLFSLLWVPSVFAANEICLDGTNGCCSVGPNCPTGEYWNGQSCAPYVACGANENFYCSTGSCLPDTNHCATAMDDPAMAGVCCADGEILVADDATGGWVCSTPGATSGLWTQAGSDIYYDSGTVAVGSSTPLTTAGLYASRNVTSGAPTYSAYFYNQSAHTGTPANNIYGLSSNAYASGINNTNTVYGIYANAQNSSTAGCIAGECPESIGVGSNASGPTSTGLQASGEYVGVRAQVPAGSTTSGALGLLVEQNKPNETAARFECEGTCTSAVFLDGNSSISTTSNSGYVLVGSPTSGHLSVDTNGLQAKSNGTTPTSLFLNTSGTGNVLVNMSHNSYGSTVCRLGETLGYCSSLRELKEEVKNLALDWEAFLNLRPVTFQWKDQEVNEGMEDLGFIAQEVEATYPILAEYNDGALGSVKYRQMTALLTLAIQDLKTELDQKDQEIDQLKALVCLDHPEADVCQ